MAEFDDMTLTDLVESLKKLKESMSVYYIPSVFVQEFDKDGERVAYKLVKEDVHLIHPDSVETFRAVVESVGMKLVLISPEEMNRRWRKCWDEEQLERSKKALDLMVDGLYEQTRLEIRQRGWRL